MVTSPKTRQPIWQLMGRLFRAHPWHGVRLGEKGSDVVTCYIEITPSDTVNPCEITHVYGRDEAFDVIRRAQADYHEKFGSLELLLDAAMLSSPTG